MGASFFMPENCTYFARPLHCGAAYFYVLFKRKVGELMGSYDNDEMLMMLDDDLFLIEKDDRNVDRVEPKSDRP